MFDRERLLYAFLLDYIRASVADIGEDELTHQATPGTNPPVWILGHLALATDYALKTLGEPTQCPRAWHASFGPGTKPLADQKVSPTKAELLAAIEKGHELVSAAAATADPARMDEPHSIPFLKQSKLQTNGDLLAHLLTTHEALHIGQLSVWRRATGRPPLV